MSEQKITMRLFDYQELTLRANWASKVSGIEKTVCDDIARRQQFGVNKYGTTVADNPLDLRAWLQHAYEECLDQAVYLRRAIAEIDDKNAA